MQEIDNMIKLLIVDDSTFMRVKIRNLLESEPEIKIVGIARDGRDAVKKTLILKPDVITMDINMPDISGIEAVEMIMEKCPTPIIMISSLSYSGSKITLEALEKGAVDFIHKDQLSEEILINKIFVANSAKLGTTCTKTGSTIDIASKTDLKHDIDKLSDTGSDVVKPSDISKKKVSKKKQTTIDIIHPDESLINLENVRAKSTYREIETSDEFIDISIPKISTYDDSSEIPEDSLTANRKFSIIGIGISTGGPKALSHLLPNISPDIPASIVIAQHIPAAFSKPLAERLDGASNITVKEAEDGEFLIPGYAYLCPGGKHMVIEHTGFITLYDKEIFPNHHFCPSASILMSTIARAYADKALCIIMTGMGSDGLEGIAEARKSGSYIMAQSENSSTIFGMPKAIISNNLQHEIVHLDRMAERINKLCVK
jgi:two-component system chemotaxis response regulator CheB